MIKYILTIGLLICPTLSWGAITCSGTSYPFNTPTDPQAQNHTIPSLTNGIVLVHSAVRNGARSVQSTPTVGGVSTTRINVRTNSTDTVTELFYLINPSAGSQSVSVDWDATPLSYVLTVVTCDGVNQAAPIASSNAATGSSSTASVDCTSAAGQLVLDFFSADAQAGSSTPGGGQSGIDRDTADASLEAGSSSEPGASTVTMSQSLATNNDWATICAALAPATTSRSFSATIFQ